MLGTRNGEEVAAARGVLHFDGLQAEAMRLAEAARDYLLTAGMHDARHADGDPVRHLATARETTRLVSRIGYCIAWLLARRAALAGEVAVDGESSWRLGGREVCLAEPDPGELGAAALPHRLAELLGRSADLYRRLERLDRALDGC